MKTFTLRLTELEADALERLAYVNGKSKNKMITSMIANAYGDTDTGSLVLGDEIINMSLDNDFWRGAKEALFDKMNDERYLADEDVIKVLRAVEYAMEKTEDPKVIDRLEGEKAEIIDAFML